VCVKLCFIQNTNDDTGYGLKSNNKIYAGQPSFSACRFLPVGFKDKKNKMNQFKKMTYSK